jgi:hypothetical protein
LYVIVLLDPSGVLVKVRSIEPWSVHVTGCFAVATSVGERGPVNVTTFPRGDLQLLTSICRSL